MASGKYTIERVDVADRSMVVTLTYEDTDLGLLEHKQLNFIANDHNTIQEFKDNVDIEINQVGRSLQNALKAKVDLDKDVGIPKNIKVKE